MTDDRERACDECGTRHPRTFWWRGRSRAWHETQDERAQIAAVGRCLGRDLNPRTNRAREIARTVFGGK